MNISASHITVGIAIVLSSCNRNDPPNVLVQAPPAVAVPKDSFSTSKEILLGSRLKFDYTPRPGSALIETAYEVPRMDRLLRGPYSYQGAFAEFKAMCGFELPRWINPVKGDYIVHKTSGSFVCQANLHFQTDPNRIGELGELVSDANKLRWPDRGFMSTTFQHPDPSTRKFMQGSYLVEEGKIQNKVRITIFEDGEVIISNARGVAGWDQ
jgi:hypothetical protein